MYQNNLNNLLLQCLSDNEIVRSNAYAQLCQLENESNFSYQLFQLYLNSLDSIKKIALLTCINTLSRNIYKSDLSEFKSNLPELLYKININRQNLAEAKHLSVLLRKLVRHEYPQKWPELLNLQIESFQNIIKILNVVEGDYNSVLYHLNSLKTSMFVSNYIIKEQVSKRLLRDRNEMYKITQALFPLISDIWYKFNNNLSEIVITAHNNYNNDLELINSIYQTSTLMDSLLLQLLYYGQKTPYLDKGIISLISNVLTKTSELFKSKYKCEFLYKNIRKLLKFITHLIEHEPLLFALVDLDSFLHSLVNYLTIINNDYELKSIINYGLGLINALFGSFTFNQEPTSHNIIYNIDDINLSIYSDSIKILKNQCSLRLQYHFRDDGIPNYILWLLNNFIMLSQRDLEVWNEEMSESFASLDYLPQSLISNGAASIITSLCSFKRNVNHVITFIDNEICKCSFENYLHFEAVLHLISASVKMIAKHFEHGKILDILQRVLLTESPLYLKLRSLDLLNNIVKNYIYPDEQGILVLNILIHCLSYSGHMNQVIKIVTLSPLYNFYIKTNEFFFWQVVDDTGMSPSSKIIQLVMNLFISVNYSRVQTKCMNIICKLVKELDIHNNDVSTNQFINLLEDILEVYKKSNWELRESILHLSLSLINSFDPYKCFISNTSNVLIYKFLIEIIINTMDFTSLDNKFIKHIEYQELFYSIWVSLLRILPSKLVNVDSILIDNIFFIFDKVISKNYDFVNQPSEFHNVVLEYLSLTISISEECVVNPDNSLQNIITQKIQLSHLFNLIENLVSNGILVNKLLTLVYLMPNCELSRYNQYSQQLIIKLWREMDISENCDRNDDESAFESFLPCIISYYNYSFDIFDNFLINVITTTDKPKERLLNLLTLIEGERSRHLKLYACIIAIKITKIIENLFPGIIDQHQIIAKLDEYLRVLTDLYKDSEDSGRTFVPKRSTYSIGTRTSSHIEDIKTPLSYRIYNLMDKLYLKTMGNIITTFNY